MLKWLSGRRWLIATLFSSATRLDTHVGKEEAFVSCGCRHHQPGWDILRTIALIRASVPVEAGKPGDETIDLRLLLPTTRSAPPVRQ
ncbi:MAG: hypothetical protein IMW89_23155 [Ktedonobacteraceae bacterium]|nr:hypothetical protein [Ktedonobacteraceae bacterium]